MNVPAEILQNAYWKRVESASESTDTQEQIFMAVGAALSDWESAESALATLYAVLCDADGTSYSAIIRTFGSVTSSGTRRNIIEATAEIYFGGHWNDQRIKKRLVGLLTAFGEASRRRDEFAHGQAYGFSLNGKHLGVFLFPSQYIASRNHAFPVPVDGDPFSSLPAKYRYTASEIHDFARKFRELRDAVFQLTIAIRRIGGTPGIALVLLMDDNGATQQGGSQLT